MSLESELRSNTVALDVMTQSLDKLCSMLVSMQASHAEDDGSSSEPLARSDESTADKKTDKPMVKELKTKPKIDDDEGEDSKRGDDESESDSNEPNHTHKELRDILNEYKEQVGIALARKLLPKIGYDNSANVPADKIDEVFDIVYELVHGNSDGDDL